MIDLASFINPEETQGLLSRMIRSKSLNPPGDVTGVRRDHRRGAEEARAAGGSNRGEGGGGQCRLGTNGPAGRKDDDLERPFRRGHARRRLGDGPFRRRFQGRLHLRTGRQRHEIRARSHDRRAGRAEEGGNSLQGPHRLPGRGGRRDGERRGDAVHGPARDRGGRGLRDRFRAHEPAGDDRQPGTALAGGLGERKGEPRGPSPHRRQRHTRRRPDHQRAGKHSIQSPPSLSSKFPTQVSRSP